VQRSLSAKYMIGIGNNELHVRETRAQASLPNLATLAPNNYLKIVDLWRLVLVAGHQLLDGVGVKRYGINL